MPRRRAAAGRRKAGSEASASKLRVNGRHTQTQRTPGSGRSKIAEPGRSHAVRPAKLAAAGAARRGLAAAVVAAAAAAARRAPARRAGARADRGRRVHGRGAVRRRRRRPPRARARGGARLERGAREGAGADRARGRRRGDADAPGAAGDAPAAHGQHLPLRCDRAGAGGGDAGRELRAGHGGLALVLQLPAGARRRGGAGAVRSGAPTGAAGGGGHPRRVPARGRADPADGRLAGGGAARDRQRHGRQHADAESPGCSRSQIGRRLAAQRATAQPIEERTPLEALLPPEPEPGKLVVRATHVEAPSLDGDRPLEPVDPWADDEVEDEPQEPPELDPEPDELPPAAEADEEPRERIAGVRAASPEDLTPQGRLREHVTDDPDFEWRVPEAARVLSRSSAEQSRPDTAGQERTAASLVEALGHFGVQAKVIGTVAGPAHHPLRAAPGAGDEGREGDAAEGRPRLRAGRDRHPHPRADPRQAGGGGGGARTRAGGSCASATSSRSRPRIGRR